MTATSTVGDGRVDPDTAASPTSRQDCRRRHEPRHGGRRRRIAEPRDLLPIVDDGKRTIVMDAIDLAALGLDPVGVRTRHDARRSPRTIEDETSGVVETGSTPRRATRPAASEEEAKAPLDDDGDPAAAHRARTDARHRRAGGTDPHRQVRARPRAAR